MRPPDRIDGAQVLWWAWADEPFFVMRDGDGHPVAEICGLAIARYDGSSAAYRFSCDRSWRVINDAEWPDETEAMTARSGNYDVELVRWEKLLRG